MLPATKRHDQWMCNFCVHQERYKLLSSPLGYFSFITNVFFFNSYHAHYQKVTSFSSAGRPSPYFLKSIFITHSKCNSLSFSRLSLPAFPCRQQTSSSSVFELPYLLASSEFQLPALSRLWLFPQNMLLIRCSAVPAVTVNEATALFDRAVVNAGRPVAEGACCIAGKNKKGDKCVNNGKAGVCAVADTAGCKMPRLPSTTSPKSC